jgi:hypothetical protein
MHMCMQPLLHVVAARRATYDGVGKLDARVGAIEACGSERARARDG